ncbi:MAG: ATP phosphoribosyltransferase [SAR202 cluster bacterium]|nr:ATP phosphoribosyltransferase [SAR202 cluster bacterium]
MLRLAIPSDGALSDPAQAFLKACGLSVSRPNPRKYTADIPSVPGVVVHFQRGSDIAMKVEEGSADMGIVGHDTFVEKGREGGDAEVVIDQLGFGHSELVLGVPDSWVDVTSLSDLADLSMEFRQQGRDLRIATKYPRVVERFLLSNGVNYISLVPSSGTLEAAPVMGYADIIADISSTGTTMSANRLKTVHGGTIMKSEACLIINKPLIIASEAKLSQATAIVERIEAHRQSLEYYSVTANMRGESPEDVARFVLEQAYISGLRGPTISRVFTRDGAGMYAVTVIVEKNKLLQAVEQFRKIGGSSVTVSQPHYVFHSECKAARRLRANRQ